MLRSTFLYPFHPGFVSLAAPPPCFPIGVFSHLSMTDPIDSTRKNNRRVANHREKLFYHTTHAQPEHCRFTMLSDKSETYLFVCVK